MRRKANQGFNLLGVGIRSCGRLTYYFHLSNTPYYIMSCIKQGFSRMNYWLSVGRNTEDAWPRKPTLFLSESRSSCFSIHDPITSFSLLNCSIHSWTTRGLGPLTSTVEYPHITLTTPPKKNLPNSLLLTLPIAESQLTHVFLCCMHYMLYSYNKIS